VKAAAQYAFHAQNALQFNSHMISLLLCRYLTTCKEYAREKDCEGEPRSSPAEAHAELPTLAGPECVVYERDQMQYRLRP